MKMREYPPLAADHPLVGTDKHRCAVCHAQFRAGDVTQLIPVDPSGRGGTVQALPAHAKCVTDMTYKMDIDLQLKCPQCGQSIGGNVPIAHSELPNPGDVAMCFHCGNHLRYDETLKLQPLTARDYMALPEEIRRTLEKMRAAL